jgi:hypothetical protein
MHIYDDGPARVKVTKEERRAEIIQIGDLVRVLRLTELESSNRRIGAEWTRRPAIVAAVTQAKGVVALILIPLEEDDVREAIRWRELGESDARRRPGDLVCAEEGPALVLAVDPEDDDGALVLRLSKAACKEIRRARRDAGGDGDGARG